MSVINIVRVHQHDIDLEGLTVAPDLEVDAVAHAQAALYLGDVVRRLDLDPVALKQDIADLNALGLGVRALGDIGDLESAWDIVMRRRVVGYRADGYSDRRAASDLAVLDKRVHYIAHRSTRNRKADALDA